MSATFCRSPLDPTSRPYTKHASIVYEDTATGLRACRSLNFLFPPSEDFVVRRRLWRWDLLNDRVTYRRSVAEAASCDLVILSAHGTNALPEKVKNWVADWLVLRTSQACVFGALLDNELPALHGCCHATIELRQLLTGSGVEFFYSFEDVASRTAKEFETRLSSELVYSSRSTF